MSRREEIQEELATFLQEAGLGEVYGVIAGNHGKYRSLTFCRARHLDGEIRIYSEKYFYVTWQSTASPFHRANLVFRSIDEVKQHITELFL